ncbi:MAG TPA: ATP-binding protein, partial [Rhizobiales bacterium]|nr:ATP-binding protein [Hyphomicrobiales bacterium]
QPLKVAMSPENLEMMLSNLIDNARQHKADRVEISADAGNGKVVIRVHDNGEGISPANRAKIFTPFFTTRRSAGGTGLGLGIVRSIAEAHGGAIRVMESTKGALFELTLPLDAL